MESDKISARTVAQILGVSASRVHQLVRDGTLKPCEQNDLGNLFSRTEVEALASARWAAKGSR